jgi:hypothetical protein
MARPTAGLRGGDCPRPDRLSQTWRSGRVEQGGVLAELDQYRRQVSLQFVKSRREDRKRRQCEQFDLFEDLGEVGVPLVALAQRLSELRAERLRHANRGRDVIADPISVLFDKFVVRVPQLGEIDDGERKGAEIRRKRWIPSLHLLLLTTCNTVGMSVNVSVRLDDRLAERLRLRARAAGESLSDRLRRYAEEGARRDEHPMITFRDGPAGRRAGLIGGPDVWEVAMWTDDLGPVTDPAAELATDGVVSRPQVDAVLAYRAAYPEEIQARIDLHRSETAAAEAR